MIDDPILQRRNGARIAATLCIMLAACAAIFATIFLASLHVAWLASALACAGFSLASLSLFRIERSCWPEGYFERTCPRCGVARMINGLTGDFEHECGECGWREPTLIDLIPRLPPPGHLTTTVYTKQMPPGPDAPDFATTSSAWVHGGKGVKVRSMGNLALLKFDPSNNSGTIFRNCRVMNDEELSKWRDDLLYHTPERPTNEEWNAGRWDWSNQERRRGYPQ